MTVLLLTDHGTYLGKSKEQFKITFGMSDKPISYMPATKVEGIIIDAKVSISSGAFDLVRAYGITIIWQDYKDDDGLILQPFNAHGSVEVRRNQYTSLEDERGVIFASKIVHAACLNKLVTIKRMSRYRVFNKFNQTLIDKIENSLDEFTKHTGEYTRITLDLRQYLMNTEAQITKLYYQLVEEYLQSKYWQFEKRSRRPATNPFNVLLNYGYAILKGRMTQAIAISGLDIYGGFLHTDRSGRESLVLDLMEEFRQVAVDQVIFKLIAAEELHEHQFPIEEGVPTLTKEIKKIYVPKLFEQFSTFFDHQSLSQWFIHQGRHLASYLRGIEKEYQPFILNQGDPW